MYELWATQGQGGTHIATFNTLAETFEAISKLEGHASFAIKLPDGTWYNWENEGQ
jgi:hypothetical protein